MSDLLQRLDNLACEGEWCSPLAQEAADRAERDEQTAELSRLTVERAKLMNDNDALRALLQDAVSKMRMVENHVCPPDEWDETVEAIDAALARGEKL